MQVFENNYGIKFKLVFNPSSLHANNPSSLDASCGPKSAAFAINAVLEDEGRPFDAWMRRACAKQSQALFACTKTTGFATCSSSW